MKTFTLANFNKKYPDDAACLDAIFQARLGGQLCPSCGRGPKFYRLKERKAYSCQFCGHHVYPLAGTIFHKSATPLKVWFSMIYLFMVSKNGVSAMEIQRLTGVTYKCAHRMGRQIRTLLGQDQSKLSGKVEADETYIGGKRRGGEGGRGKPIVMGMLQRGGRLRARVIKNRTEGEIMGMVRENLEDGSTLMTDSAKSYRKTSGYTLFNHKTVNHSAKEYVDFMTHVNGIEGVWAQLKRSIHGTYHVISPRHLQSYVDEFVFRYNYRRVQELLFDLALQRVVQRAR